MAISSSTKGEISACILRFTNVTELGLDATFLLFSLDWREPFVHHGDYYLDVDNDYDLPKNVSIKLRFADSLFYLVAFCGIFKCSDLDI